MNEELQTAITSVINSMVEIAESAYALGEKHIPDVVNQLLMFNFVTSGIWSLFFLFCALASAKIVTLSLKSDDDAKQIFGAIFGILSGCASAALFAASFMKFLKLIIAPKVWLIEYAAALVK